VSNSDWPLAMISGLLTFDVSVDVGRANLGDRETMLRRSSVGAGAMKRWPVEAAGAVDAKNAPAAPWKTAKGAVFHSSHKPYGYQSRILHHTFGRPARKNN
jgi:hypothetical protein